QGGLEFSGRTLLKTERSTFIKSFNCSNDFDRLNNRHALANGTLKSQHGRFTEIAVLLAPIVETHDPRSPTRSELTTRKFSQRVQRRLERILRPAHRLTPAQDRNVGLFKGRAEMLKKRDWP